LTSLISSVESLQQSREAKLLPRFAKSYTLALAASANVVTGLRRYKQLIASDGGVLKVEQRYRI
jgi:hypothetical protein